MVDNPSDTSRSIILSKLKERKGLNWGDRWSNVIPGGTVFPKAENLISSFQNELAQIGGEVFTEKDQEALFNKLRELIKERNWGAPFIADKHLRETLQMGNIKVLPFEDSKNELEVGISSCEALIALTGSVMVSSKSGPGRKINVSPLVHIIIAKKSQLVDSIDEGFNLIKERYAEMPSQLSMITGPSRTADIEKTLVLGAHGPKELIVLVDLNS